MACINANGSLTPSARRVLFNLSSASTLEEAAKSTGLPLFRLRSSIREMLEAGLLEEKEGKYVATKLGQAKMEK